jgi:hypothetical protein
MIYMNKITAVICVVLISAFFAGAAYSQSTNGSAYFMLDTDLVTAGYQGMGGVMDIGASTEVGFAIYGMQIDSIKGIEVKFEWDAAKAEFRDRDSGEEIFDDTVDINGSEITLAEESNILVGTIGSSPITDTDGEFAAAYFIQGAGGSETDSGLLYFAVFRTAADFQTTDQLTIKASVKVSDPDGNERNLGTRYFLVNASVDVKPATWKEVKEQFKDF